MNILVYICGTVLCLLAVFFIYKKILWFDKMLFIQSCVFIILSLFFGRVLNIYAIIPFWDKILHFLSGFILYRAGNLLCKKLGGNSKVCLLFSLIFALAGAGIWEIYEFSLDNLFGFNSQNASLTDTMLDMIAGSSSALLYVITKKISAVFLR